LFSGQFKRTRRYKSKSVAFARKDDGTSAWNIERVAASQMEAKTPEKEKCIQSAISKFK